MPSLDAMQSYSARKFRKDWVYAIAQDFHSHDGSTPASWADGQPLEWGHEHAKIPLSTEPGAASLNADSSLLAIALEREIHIYNISDLSLYQVLKGHCSCIDALSFHPKDAGTLVSCAMYDRAGPGDGEPEIIFWNLDEERKRTLLSAEVIHSVSKQAVDNVVTNILSNSSPPWQMDSDDQTALTTEIEKVLTNLNIQSHLRTQKRLNGRLVSNFGSHTFNSTGTSLAFLPGPRPKSNDDTAWDISIYSLSSARVQHTLTGHRDAIMWLGFSPDDTLIASVSWDQTFRIWDHKSGKLLHLFLSHGQNWTGAFSPDSRFFAGTSGEGRLWVWDVVHGLEVLTQDLSGSSEWHRHLDWSPDGKRLVIGSQKLGTVIIYDIKSQSIVQSRVLSTKLSPPILQEMGSRFLEINGLRYVDQGRKIAIKCACDDGLEVYDLLENRKWRFAPAQGLERGQSNGEFVVLEEKGMIASVDADAVRFCKVPFGQGE